MTGKNKGKKKKYRYRKIHIPLSYNESEVPNIHRIVDLVANKELSGWRFVEALNFTVDEKTGLSRPAVIKFKRPKRGKLRTIIFDYMPVTVANDGLAPDSGPGWEKVGVIEYDALKRPRTILFRKENTER